MDYFRLSQNQQTPKIARRVVTQCVRLYPQNKKMASITMWSCRDAIGLTSLQFEEIGRQRRDEESFWISKISWRL